MSAEIEYTPWQELRASWVNGNQAYVRDCLRVLPRNKLVDLVLEATQEFYRGLDMTAGMHGSELIDLIEMLRSFQSYYGNE